MFQRKGNIFILKHLVITLKNVTKKIVDKPKTNQISQTIIVVNNKLFIPAISAQHTFTMCSILILMQFNVWTKQNLVHFIFRSLAKRKIIFGR
jgi:hypothetical protein